MRSLATLALILGFAAPAHAAGFFQSAWGQNVDRVNPATGPEVCTVSDDCQAGTQGGVGGAFFAPSSVASDGAGNVYVLEEAGSRVSKYSAAGVFQRMWGKDVIQSGTGTDTGSGFEICTVAADCKQGLQGTLGGELSHPEGIAVDSAGTVYVADTDNNRVQEYTSSGAFIQAFGLNVDSTQMGGFEVCTVAIDCTAGAAVPATGGNVYSPAAIAVDSGGAIYIASGSRRVDRFTTTGGVPTFDRAWGPDVDTAPGTGFEVCTVAAQCKSGAVGTGLGGETNLPVGVAVAAGDVYVIGGAGFRVDKYTTAGAFLRAWGKDVIQPGAPADTGTGFEVCTVAANCKMGVTGSSGGEFRSPNDAVAPASDGIAVDPSGTTVYVADRENQRLQLFTSEGAFKSVWGLDVDTAAGTVGPQICTVAANCTSGSQESPLPGGGMSSPIGVAADATGAVYEVDQTASRIQRLGTVVAPDAPVVIASDPGPDPANDNTPHVTGTATAGSTVDLYDNPDCTGTPIGTGTAAQFASPGITATVPDDSITQIYAQASNSGGTSPCSTTSVSYEEISTLRWHVHFGAASASVSEGAGSITVTISRSGVTDGTASVHYATADGTAGPGDHGAVSGTLKFSPGQASRTVDIPIVDDQAHEADETFTIALSSPGLGTDIDAPATETITIVDDDPIDTAITGGPTGPTRTATPTFTFTADPPAGATFACSFDGGTAIACGSPFVAPKLPEGPHTISVRASTPGGIADPSPATRTFFVDTVAPQVGIAVHATPGLGAEVSPGVFTGSVTVAAGATDPDPGSGVAELGCVLDPPAVPASAADVGAGPCPAATAPGAHVAYAVAVDAAGNVGPIATAAFQIVPAPDTTITSGPDGVSWTTIPTFTFISTDAAATFRCRIDGGAEFVCKSPYTTPVIKGGGAHSFTVAAVSPTGLADPSPARRDFRIGTTEVHKYQCELRGFTIVPTAEDEYRGCSIEPAGQPCSGIFPACQPVLPACPLGARCTYAATASGANDDTQVAHLVNATVVARVTSVIRANHGFAAGAPGLIAFVGCWQDDHGEHISTGYCPRSTSGAAVGDGTAPTFLCPMNHTANFSGGITPSAGANAARFGHCDFTMTIEAAPTLLPVPAVAGDGFSTYVPGPGTVTASPAGSGAKKASIARVTTSGLFRTSRKSVKRAGPVVFKLTLSRSAKATLKKSNRLVIRVKLVFKPKKGKSVTKTATVTLRKPVAPKRKSKK